ncbi:MAG TPA: hypothetical protein ENK02_01550 [Planctomycetes bacterium]|nr:hypothetical protein [Planctomycetota bacterium]
MIRAPLLSFLALTVLFLGGSLPAQIRSQSLSCNLCHPGADRSFGRSVHAEPLRKPLSDKERPQRNQACLSCHLQGRLHQEDPPSKKAGLASCSRCHGDKLIHSYKLLGTFGQLSHPSRAEAVRIQEKGRMQKLLLREQPGAALSKGSPWTLGGRLGLGLRLVDVDGSRRRFDQDLGLDSGFRLTRLQAELNHQRGGRIFEAELHDLEEREFGASAKTGRWLPLETFFEGRLRKRKQVFDSAGDFHGYDRKRLDQEYRLVENGGNLGEISLTFERRSARGRSVGTGIGNPNLSPLVPVQGIPIDLFSLEDRWSLAKSWGDTEKLFDLELGYTNGRRREDLNYARPSPIDPFVTERENSRSASSFRGPDARMRFRREGFLGENTLDLSLGGSYQTVHHVEEGTLEGLDTSAFSTETLGLGRGNQREGSLLLLLERPLGEEWRLSLEGLLVDQRNRTLFTRFDRTIRTSPPSNLLVRSDQTLVTRFQERSLSLSLEGRLLPGLSLSLGYSYSRQTLHLPDLEVGDSDFRSGNLERHAPQGSLIWRPREGTRLRLRVEGLASGGARPTETQPELGTRVRIDLRRKWEKDQNFSLFAAFDRRSNNLSSTERRRDSYGFSGAWLPFGKTRINLASSWSKTRNRTLSTFYFAPSTTPVPTLVGYRGQTLLSELNLDAPLGAGIDLDLGFSVQRSTGSLVMTFFDSHLGLKKRWSRHLSLGLRAFVSDLRERSLDLRETYHARGILLYGETGL